MSEKNNKYTPNLSFPEFTGEWEEKTLGEVCDSILTGFPFKGEDITDDASGHPILRAFSIGEGIIRHGKDYDKYYPYDAEKLKKYEVRKGDIVISMDGSVGKNIALISEKEERNLLIQRVARLRITDYPIHLIFQQIISQRFKDYAAGEKKGAVIAHISQKQIELFPIYIPNSPAEQQKIASCLSTMDDLIAAQAEKVEVLKEKKTGLMQQLFPQSGETTPRLRFPEFTGEWEVKKLGEVAKKVNRKNTLLKVSRVLTNSANLGVVDQGAYFDRDIAVKENTGNYSIVEIEDFVYNPRISTAAPVGPISINKVGQGIMSPLYTIFKFHTGSILFYEQYFQTTIWHSYLKGIANFGARFDRMNITTEGFFNMPLYVPTDPAEQEKIASCLSSLDDQIAAETEKLTALKDYKKGLMQQLFPQPAK